MAPTKNASPLQVPLAGLPSIRLAGRFPHDDRGFSVRYLSSHASLHYYSYPGVIRIGSRQYNLRVGDVTVTGPGVPSSYDLPAPGYHLCIHFTFPSARGPTAAVPLHLSLGLEYHNVAQKISQIMQHQFRAERNAVARAAASAGLLELLLSLSNHRAPLTQLSNRGRVDAALETVLQQIDQQLDSPLNIPALADSVMLSQNYLAHHFRRRYGFTLQRALLIRRMELAQLLVTTTNLPVKRIGQRVGLPDPQHFNKQFRRLVGLSPTQLRAMAASEQAHWPRRWREIRQALEAREK
jgi:AraC-like DNA-binding protein